LLEIIAQMAPSCLVSPNPKTGPQAEEYSRENFLRTHFHGWLNMVAYLCRLEYAVSGRRARRLMCLMGIRDIYYNRSSSPLGQEYERYPNLVRNLTVTLVNQVRSTDIAYVPLL